MISIAMQLGLAPLPTKTRKASAKPVVTARTDTSPAERKAEIAGLLRDVGPMTRNELVEAVEVSESTVEKDTAEMIEAGELRVRQYRGINLFFLPMA